MKDTKTSYTVRLTAMRKTVLFGVDSAERVRKTVNGMPMVTSVEIIEHTVYRGKVKTERKLKESEVFDLLGIEYEVAPEKATR